MARYHYTAIGKNNAFTKGVVEAWSSKKAAKKVEKEGLSVVNMKREVRPRWERFNHFFEGVSRLDKIFLTRHLMTMLESGIAIDQALHISAEQTHNQRFRAVLQDLCARVQKGEALHVAFSHYPKYFSTFYINLIRVGEASGKLEQTLQYLLEQQERDYELLTKTRTAMLYPTVIMSALLLIVIFMMTFVIPRVTGVLIEYNVTLPLATRILIGVSRFLVQYGLYLIPVVALLVYLLRRALRTPRGKWYWDSFLLSIPRLKTIFIELNCARLTRSMSAMMKSGIAMDKAVALASEVTTNSKYQRSFRSGVDFVQRGVPLAEVLKGFPQLYPPLTVRMVDVGERTGKLDYMFARVATFYEKSVMTALENMTAIIEPALLITVGIAVGFVGIAVLTPIWNFSETI